MKNWNLRTHEVAYLLNPAFCGRILYTVIKMYGEKTNRSFPFPLIYLVLPLILHQSTRNNINSRTQLLLWVQRHPHLLIDFPKRARELVPITNEAIEFLLQTGRISLTSSGELGISANTKILSRTRFVDAEVADCLKKGEHIAKWFAGAGKVENIYIGLGVRP
ncbi:MAG: three component ABC system middle component [Monoglobales bacterium]